MPAFPIYVSKEPKIVNKNSLINKNISNKSVNWTWVESQTTSEQNDPFHVFNQKLKCHPDAKLENFWYLNNYEIY